MSRLSSNRLSRWNALSTHLTLPIPTNSFSFAAQSLIHVPCFFLISFALPLSASLPPVNAQYSCIVSRREGSMLSFICHCSWALNSPHKQWHTLQQRRTQEALVITFEILFWKIHFTEGKRLRSHVWMPFYVTDPHSSQKCPMTKGNEQRKITAPDVQHQIFYHVK